MSTMSASTSYMAYPDTSYPDTTDSPIEIGLNMDIELPDGTIIHVDQKGNFQIVDNATVVYRRNWVRDFNRYINASDLLENFIDYLGSLGVRRSEFKTIPVEMFIKWVVIQAATQDGDPIPDIDPTVHLPHRPRCRHCGRFISPSRKLDFCSRDHMIAYADRVGFDD